jgi:hypothetical protein
MNRFTALHHELEAARTVEWLLNELFLQTEDGSAEETALLRASIAQELRVVRLECME